MLFRKEAKEVLKVSNGGVSWMEQSAVLARSASFETVLGNGAQRPDDHLIMLLQRAQWHCVK